MGQVEDFVGALLNKWGEDTAEYLKSEDALTGFRTLWSVIETVPRTLNDVAKYVTRVEKQVDVNELITASKKTNLSVKQVVSANKVLAVIGIAIKAYMRKLDLRDFKVPQHMLDSLEDKYILAKLFASAVGTLSSDPDFLVNILNKEELKLLLELKVRVAGIKYFHETEYLTLLQDLREMFGGNIAHSFGRLRFCTGVVESSSMFEPAKILFGDNLTKSDFNNVYKCLKPYVDSFSGGISLDITTRSNYTMTHIDQIAEQKNVTLTNAEREAISTLVELHSYVSRIGGGSDSDQVFWDYTEDIPYSKFANELDSCKSVAEVKNFFLNVPIQWDADSKALFENYDDYCDAVQLKAIYLARRMFQQEASMGAFEVYGYWQSLCAKTSSAPPKTKSYLPDNEREAFESEPEDVNNNKEFDISREPAVSDSWAEAVQNAIDYIAKRNMSELVKRLSDFAIDSSIDGTDNERVVGHYLRQIIKAEPGSEPVPFLRTNKKADNSNLSNEDIKAIALFLILNLHSEILSNASITNVDVWSGIARTVNNYRPAAEEEGAALKYLASTVLNLAQLVQKPEFLDAVRTLDFRAGTNLQVKSHKDLVKLLTSTKTDWTSTNVVPANMTCKNSQILDDEGMALCMLIVWRFIMVLKVWFAKDTQVLPALDKLSSLR